MTLLWITRGYEVFKDRQGKPLIHLGEAYHCEWYTRGRVATLAEVNESIASGLPALETIARTEKGGLEALQRYVERFQKWLPAEDSQQ